MGRGCHGLPLSIWLTWLLSMNSQLFNKERPHNYRHPSEGMFHKHIWSIQHCPNWFSPSIQHQTSWDFSNFVCCFQAKAAGMEFFSVGHWMVLLICKPVLGFYSKIFKQRKKLIFSQRIQDPQHWTVGQGMQMISNVPSILLNTYSKEYSFCNRHGVSGLIHANNW